MLINIEMKAHVGMHVYICSHEFIMLHNYTIVDNTHYYVDSFSFECSINSSSGETEI